MGWDPKLLEDIDRVSLQFKEVCAEVSRIWASGVLWTWHWWLDIALTVLPWALWILIRDRKRTNRLLYAGLFTVIAATILDIVGLSAGLWHYNTWVLPAMPEYLPWDFAVMPVTAMLFYQFFPKINPWLKGVVFALFGAFVAESIFSSIGLYDPTGWKFYYSLPLYLLIYMAGYGLYRAVLHESAQSSEPHR